MDWYVPISILPGIGMLIVSSTNQMLTISSELGGLLTCKCSPLQHKIARLKIVQLGRITRANTFMYIAAASFMSSGILGAFLNVEHTAMLTIPDYLFIVGALFVLVGLILLIDFAYKTIIIRKFQFSNNHLLEERQPGNAEPATDAKNKSL